MERTTPGPGRDICFYLSAKKAMLTLGQAALEDAWEYMARESVRCLSSMKPPAFSAVMGSANLAAAKCTGIQ